MTSARYTADKSVNLSDLEVDSSPPGTWKHQCPCGDPIDILGTDVINRRTIYPCTVCNWTIFLQFGDLDVAFALFYGKRYLEAVEMYVLLGRRQSLCVNPNSPSLTSFSQGNVAVSRPPVPAALFPLLLPCPPSPRPPHCSSTPHFPACHDHIHTLTLHTPTPTLHTHTGMR